MLKRNKLYISEKECDHQAMTICDKIGNICSKCGKYLSIFKIDEQNSEEDIIQYHKGCAEEC